MQGYFVLKTFPLPNPNSLAELSLRKSHIILAVSLEYISFRFGFSSDFFMLKSVSFPSFEKTENALVISSSETSPPPSASESPTSSLCSFKEANPKVKSLSI